MIHEESGEFDESQIFMNKSEPSSFVNTALWSLIFIYTSLLEIQRLLTNIYYWC